MSTLSRMALSFSHLFRIFGMIVVLATYTAAEMGPFQIFAIFISHSRPSGRIAVYSEMSVLLW